MLLPFDAHNHIHLGPSPPTMALGWEPGGLPVAGMAVMSTHPRDFDPVCQLAVTLMATEHQPVVVPCLGVHPWWLGELTDEDWGPQTDDCDIDRTTYNVSTNTPQWIARLERSLLAHPHAVVGEIGLDGVRFDPVTRELVCPLDRQVQALTLQLQVAARLRRPVSLHAVQCFGALLDTLSSLVVEHVAAKKEMKLKQKENHSLQSPPPTTIPPALPPRIYFHAFGGKLGTVDQLLAVCRRGQCQAYFGFAPVVNFRSPKTAEVMQKIGLERLVLETDHEDASLVSDSLRQGIAFIAEALKVDEATVIETTTQNAYELYCLSSPVQS